MWQLFALLPPSASNLATFVAWASVAHQLPVFLAEQAAGALKVEVHAGATLFIPGKLALASYLGQYSLCMTYTLHLHLRACLAFAAEEGRLWRSI